MKSSSENRFIFIPHTADIQIRVFGNTKQELFKHALEGMFQAIGPQSPHCTTIHGIVECNSLPISHTFEVKAIDDVQLLVDFLSEALYLSDVNDEAYFDVMFHDFSDTFLKAIIYGVKVTGFEVVELKAVTYHGLVIEQMNNRWQADIVFDI